MDHILERHRGRKETEAGEFVGGAKRGEIEQWVKDCVYTGVWQYRGKGIWWVEKAVGVGGVGLAKERGGKGKTPTDQLRVVIDETGFVITAFPVAKF